MQHILERHSPEYWDGGTKAIQTFLRPGTTISDVQNVVGDVLTQNRQLIAAQTDQFSGRLVGQSGGLNYQISIAAGRVVQLYVIP